MALSGNLREFELPDIFQLIGQQKKTGRLVLIDGERRGFVVFRQGEIVSAGCDRDDTITMLSRYLILARRHPQAKINEFINFCKGNAHIFADVVLRIQYISEDELAAVAGMAVEDLVCALFLWRRGNYQFEPLATVDDFMVAGVSFTSDAIMMEAMRRVDDWPRLRASMPSESILALSPAVAQSLTSTPAQTPPTADQLRFLFGLLDASRTVAEVVSASFLSSYRTTELLGEALKSGQISIASQLSASPVRTRAPVRKHDKKRETFLVSISALATAGVISLVLLTGTVLLPRLLFGDRYQQSIVTRNEYAQAIFESKTRVASLQYRAVFGMAPSNPQDLRASGLLTLRDWYRPAR